MSLSVSIPSSTYTYIYPQQDAFCLLSFSLLIFTTLYWLESPITTAFSLLFSSNQPRININHGQRSFQIREDREFLRRPAGLERTGVGPVQVSKRASKTTVDTAALGKAFSRPYSAAFIQPSAAWSIPSSIPSSTPSTTPPTTASSATSSKSSWTGSSTSIGAETSKS